jgi:hypothetical protein
MTGKFARLLVGTCMTAALSVSGFLGSMPAAHAGGGGGASCQKDTILSIAVCTGNVTVNPNVTIPVSITISDIDISKIDVNVLTVEENKILNDVGNKNEVTVKALTDIANENTVWLQDVLNIHICQVKIVEVGGVNVNIAKCK